MGSRGPIPKRAKSARTADGVRIRRLPDDDDAIFRRSVHDIPGVIPADAGLLELRSYWVQVGKEAMRQLRDPNKPGELLLTVPDTAHGDGTEMRKNALLIVLRTATEMICKIDQQLGATPMARARLPEREAEQMTLGEEFMEIARRRRSQASKDE